MQFILGVITAFVGIFMLMSFISFFFTGAEDQSNVLNKTFLELIRSEKSEIANWTGAGGAFIAETVVNNWFGIFSVLIPIFIIYVGLRMMKVSNFPWVKAIFFTSFGLIGGSVSSAFILDKLFPHSHVKWGGLHGIEIERILESSIGWPGMILLILLFILITIVIFRKSSIYKIQKTLVNTKLPTYRDESDTISNSTPEEADLGLEDEKKSVGSTDLLQQLKIKGGLPLPIQSSMMKIKKRKQKNQHKVLPPLSPLYPLKQHNR